MSGRTGDQIGADLALENAVRQVALAYGTAEPGDFMGDWLLVIEIPRLDGEPAATPYGMYMSGGSLPEHRMRGLIDVAAAINESTWSHPDDD